MYKVYIAIPYNGMAETSYKQANEVMLYYLEKGYNCFSPISHFHGVGTMGLPLDWNYWQKICLDWIKTCDELIVIIPREGIEKVSNSTGVNAEIKLAQDLGIKINYHNLGGT